MVEGGTPNTLQRNGITRDSIKVGTVIVVVGLPGEGRHACAPTAATSRSRTAARCSWDRRAPARRGRQGPERASTPKGPVMMRLASRCVADGRSAHGASACGISRRAIGGGRARRIARRARRTARRISAASGRRSTRRTGISSRTRRAWARSSRSAPPSAFPPASAWSRATRFRICRRRWRRSKTTRANWMKLRSRDQVLHAGHPARDLHAVSVPDRAVEGQRALHLRVHQREPRRPDEHARKRARRRHGWDGRSASWDGDTLVIEVTDHMPDTWFDRAGNYHSDALKVTERYTADRRQHDATTKRRSKIRTSSRSRGRSGCRSIAAASRTCS